MFTLDDPLIESAPLALATAERCCRHEANLGQNCYWFHGFWPYYRLLGVVSGVSPHGAFFRAALGALARDGAFPRILISGAADYAMLAQVLSAYGETGARAEITVLDRCETPLVLNRWYARRLPVAVETRACDILDLEDAGAFDVIATHAFLHHFPRESRPALIDKWRQLLRRGGKLVTVDRLQTSDATDPVTYGPAATRAFRDRVLAAARRAPELPGIARTDLMASAEAHARRHRYPLRSFMELGDLLTHGGFTIERLRPSEAAQEASGGGTPASAASETLADYAHILCTSG